MYILDEALQKMRKVEARQNSEEYNKTLHRWRGIKDRDLDLDTFKRGGGTGQVVAMCYGSHRAAACVD